MSPRLRHLVVMLVTGTALTTAALPATADQDPLRGANVAWRPLTTHAAATPPPTIKARAWILVDADSGSVLAALRARTRQLPASTLKTLTAVTLLPRLNLSDVYTTRRGDVGLEGSGAGLVFGGTYTVEQLFLGMLLPSGNDAATALTHVYDPDGSKALTLMNETAQRLGAKDTVVRNPTGLPIPGQYSTAADIAVFARAALANPTFRRLSQTRTVEFPGRMPKPGHVRKTYQLQNENPFVKHGVPGTVGGKTGYTRAALRTYWVAQERNGRTLLVVILGFVGPYQRVAVDLLDWGFSQGKGVGPVATLPPVRDVSAMATQSAAPSTAPSAQQSPQVEAVATRPTSVPRTATTLLLLVLPAGILVSRVVRVRRSMNRQLT